MAYSQSPWTAEPTEPNSGFNCWTLMSATGESIAWTKGYQDDSEKAANARLMAAAPELYVALRAWVESTSRDKQTGSMRPVYDAAKAALFKVA